MYHYDPSTVSQDDAAAVVARIDRYVRRHGSPYGEEPVADVEEVRQGIVTDWLSADWPTIELEVWERKGRLMFPPSFSELGCHLRAALFMAGRCRRRRWHTEGDGVSTARQAHRRRDMDDMRGAGMASRAADPARMLEAVESATAGLRSVPDRARRRRSRMMKTRNSTRGLVTITRRPVATLGEDGRVWYGEGEYTGVQFERVTVYNFRRVGDTPNRQTAKTLNRLPEGVTAADMLEALQG
jgi:hypothetical protein